MAVRNNDYLHLLVLGSMITQIEKNWQNCDSNSGDSRFTKVFV